MIILYPTETVYGLGVNAFDDAEIEKLYALKGREAEKSVSWLVRDMRDVERYGEVSEIAAKIAERFLPGPLTLVLPSKKESLPDHLKHLDTIAFRISSDPIAQKLIADFMKEHNAPLTCTSANKSGMPTLETVPGILNQFGNKKSMIDIVYDGGERVGNPSTIIKVVGDEITCLREGAYALEEIQKILNER